MLIQITMTTMNTMKQVQSVFRLDPKHWQLPDTCNLAGNTRNHVQIYPNIPLWPAKDFRPFYLFKIPKFSEELLRRLSLYLHS